VGVGKDLKLRRKSAKAGVDGQHGGQKIPTSERFKNLEEDRGWVGGWVGGGQDLKLRRNSTKAGVDGPLEKWWPCLVVGPDTEMVALPGGGA